MSEPSEIVDWLRAVRAGEVRVEHAQDELRSLADEGTQRLGSRALVFETPDGYVWVPDQFDLQCVATTRKGARCRNLVFDQGQVWSYDIGPIARLDEEWLARLLTQTCGRHDEVQAGEYAPTEWVFVRQDDVSPGVA